MQDTAEPSIGALSVFQDLRTKRGFFLFQGFGSPAFRTEQIFYAQGHQDLCSGRDQIAWAPEEVMILWETISWE